VRVTPRLRQHLADAVTPLDTPERRAKYLAGDFPRADKVIDLNRRYRWDLLWAASPTAGEVLDVICRVTGATDAHLDTVLRNIIPPLEEAS
jgi:hypothetical protein